ncbi:MAG: hypothetical protein U9R79_22125 [Armatimonadota bacterium]|nr:hypothetical protein [Armatimonadota bacterium]
MLAAESIIAWIAALVAVWWLIDWLQLRHVGKALPLRRAPLRILADVLAKLRRNRTFVGALVALWLLGTAASLMRAYLVADIGGPAPARAMPMLAWLSRPAELIPRLLGGEVYWALPRLREVPLTGWASLLVAVLLAAGLVRVMIDPPDGIDEDAARGLRWPIAFLCAHAAAAAAAIAAGQDFFWRLAGPDAPWYTPWVLGIHGLVLAGVLLAPAHALLWRMMLEIAGDGVWSFRSSIRAVGATWGSAALLLLVGTPGSVVPTEAMPPSARILNALPIIIHVLLVFAPWAIVDRQQGLLDALRQSWRLFRRRAVDVITFGLRFALLFAVLGGIVALFEPDVLGGSRTLHGPLLAVVRNLLLLLQAMTVAGLYVHLRDELACQASPRE